MRTATWALACLIGSGCGSTASLARAQDTNPSKNEPAGLLPDKRLGDYMAWGPETDERGLFRGSAYWSMRGTCDATVLDNWGPFHTSHSEQRTGWYRHDSKKGSCVVEVCGHPASCYSRVNGLLEHDLKVAFRANSRSYRAPLRMVKVADRLIAAVDPADDKRPSMKLGWLAADGVTVMIEFDDYNPKRPDAATDGLVAAYLAKYPSILKEDFARWNAAELRRTEANKIIGWTKGDAAFVALTYYPLMTNPLWSRKEPGYQPEALQAWWKANKDRCPQEWRLALMDAVVEEMAKFEGQKILGLFLLDRLRNTLPWVGSLALGDEADDELVGRAALWKAWWRENRERKLSEQWTSLFDLYVSRLREDEVPGSDDSKEARDKAGSISTRLVRLKYMAMRGGWEARAGPPGWEEAGPGNHRTQAKIIRAWKDWWAKARGKYVPDLVRESEREIAEACSCGNHK